MSLKKHDFVEIDYIAIDKETDKIFDLTSEEEAKRNKIHDPNNKYGPIVLCLGEKQVIEGLDKFLIGKDVNKEYTVEISPEEGFGKKDPKLMKLLPLTLFKKQNITPFPGLMVNMDNLLGIVRSVSGGRIIVDFNHPLAGHNLIYKIKINKIIKDNKIKIESIIKKVSDSAKVEINDEIINITDVPELFQKKLKETILHLVSGVKEVKFKTDDKK